MIQWKGYVIRLENLIACVKKIKMVQRLLPIIKTCVITFVLTHGV